MIGTGWTVAAIAATSTVTGAISYTVLKRQELRQLVAAPIESAPPAASASPPSPPPPPGHDVALASVAPPPLPPPLN